MKKNLKNKKWFSIIEVLVWIIIFLFWITGIYTMIHSTINLNEYNKNYIIWVNLAREQLELFRNIRDANFKIPRNYLAYSSNSSGLQKFEKDWIYKISNDFSDSASEKIKVKKDEKSSKDDLVLWKYDLGKLKDFQICLDKTENLYDYCGKIPTDNERKELKIFKFIIVEEISDYKEEAVKVKSKVVWYNKKFSEFEIEQIFTNYKVY